MTEKLSDERLAELRALQQKRIEGRGGVPEVRDLLKALDELAAYRAHGSKTQPNLAIDSGWLVETGHEPNYVPGYGYEPGTDAMPLLNLQELPGWPGS